MPGTRTPKPPAATAATSDRQLHDDDDLARNGQPLACADALARTSDECCRQHERLSRLTARHVGRPELTAAHAMVDTVDLALEECVSAYEVACAREAIVESADVKKLANTLWLAARDYLRRHSIAERASRQLRTHDADKLNDLQLEYELEASALLALRHACNAYFKTRPDAA